MPNYEGNVMKAGSDWQSAAVYADWLLDEGRESEAAQWRLVSRMQRAFCDLWQQQEALRQNPRLARLSVDARTHRVGFECDGRHYILSMTTAAKMTGLRLRVRVAKDSPIDNYLANAQVGRTTLAKHGLDKTARKTAVSMAKEAAWTESIMQHEANRHNWHTVEGN